jgi:hypothetical protein
VEEKSKMLKKRLWILGPVLTLLLLLSSHPSQAAPLGSPFFSVALPANPLAKLAHWLDFLPGDARAKKPRAPSRHAASVPEKHGCGIDPQGQPYCEP